MSRLERGFNWSTMARHRASSMINLYGLNYCADHTTGLIYEYSPAVYTDNGEPIIKQRDTAAIHGGLFDVPRKKLYFDMVQFIIASGPGEVSGTGAGANPNVGLMDVDLASLVFFHVDLDTTVNFKAE